mgnify:CR=1 FL=1
MTGAEAGMGRSSRGKEEGAYGQAVGLRDGRDLSARARPVSGPGAAWCQ